MNMMSSPWNDANSGQVFVADPQMSAEEILQGMRYKAGAMGVMGKPPREHLRITNTP